MPTPCISALFKGKWNLAKDFVSYEHTSASFYEEGITSHFVPKHYKDL